MTTEFKDLCIFSYHSQQKKTQMLFCSQSYSVFHKITQSQNHLGWKYYLLVF